MERQIIPYPFMSAEFIAYAEARNRKAAAVRGPLVQGTFNHLADIYRGNEERGIKPSKQWLDLAERTRTDYGRIIDKILEMWGPDFVRDLEVEMIVEMRDARRKTPRMANYFLNVLSTILNVALERKRLFGIDINVAANVARFGVKAGVKARTAYWTYEDEIRFLKDADETDPVIALGERLLAYTGQRPGDMRAMLLTDYDGSKIQVVQSKTGAKVWIPCHKDLKPYLDRAITNARGKEIANGTFVRGIRGGAMGERYFATRWDAVASRSQTAHLNRQDLRRTAVIRLSEAGCTPQQVAAITGHSLRQVEVILETYFVRTYEMATAAIGKLESYQDQRRARAAASNAETRSNREKS
jgi:integrase